MKNIQNIQIEKAESSNVSGLVSAVAVAPPNGSRSTSHNWPLSETTYSNPAATEFARTLESYLAKSTILLEAVETDGTGAIDIVLVGETARIGIQFDSRTIDHPVPDWLDSLYVLSPMDLFESDVDLLYVLMKSCPLLFSESARLQLPRQTTVDAYSFVRPVVGESGSGRTAAYVAGARSGSRRIPLVMQVFGANDSPSALYDRQPRQRFDQAA